MFSLFIQATTPLFSLFLPFSTKPLNQSLPLYLFFLFTLHPIAFSQTEDSHLASLSHLGCLTRSLKATAKLEDDSDDGRAWRRWWWWQILKVTTTMAELEGDGGDGRSWRWRWWWKSLKVTFCSPGFVAVGHGFYLLSWVVAFDCHSLPPWVELVFEAWV